MAGVRFPGRVQLHPNKLMITKQTIDEVNEKADLVTVVKKYVPGLKKKGANHTGCCPFHDEKTASFAVNEAKGIYKCFGCGAGGTNSINFVMAKEGFDYPAAVKYLANWFNIEVVETNQDEEPAEVKANRADYLKINTWAGKKYQTELLNLLKKDEGKTEGLHWAVDDLLNNRKFTKDSMINFQIGFAPDGWRFITPILLDNGKFKLAEDIGLVKESTTNNYDIYRNRIIYPIHNERGEIIGFGGRKMEDGDKSNPKFINSIDSLIYKKSEVLYGLYQAEKAIRKDGFAVLVEGYADVVSFHQTGMPNTVATCGTALTDGHAKKLKRYTKHIILMGDSDKAGDRANLKNVDLLLRHDFKVEICPLPEKHDPDSFARTFKYKEIAA